MIRFLPLFVTCIAMAASQNSRPNVLFLFADDQRADTIGAHGNPHIQTPHLDKLSSEGTRFLNHYCAGSYSGAVCVASRSMLMTGKHWPHIKDRRNWSGLQLLPEVLGNDGYRTQIVGKWHNGEKTLKRAFQTGNSIMMGGMVDHTHVPVVDLNAQSKLVNKRTPLGFSSQIFADATIDYIQRAPTDKPFFLYTAFTAPHDTRNPPQKYRDMYYKNRPPMPENFLPQHPFDNGQVAGRGRDESLAPWPRPKEMISDQICEYYGLITHLDEQVGRILAALDESPHADNTIVIYTADHGLGMGSHGLLGKQNIYEQSMKCPLIVRGPGIPAGTSVDAFTYIHDLNATVFGFAGTAGPQNADSIDLAPLWKGKKRVRESLFLPYQNLMRSVRDDRWKLHVYPKIEHMMLFDLQNDPHETKNLAALPAYASQVKRLHGMMKDWQVAVDDSLGSVTLGTNHNPKSVVYDNSKRVLDIWQPKWIRDKYFGGRSNTNHGSKKH